ncbi:MAG: HAD-IC family P-type ATPase, partial [Candidatus Helarchaeota archaeon]|nr:HAD-IC family P-type ATPase [Candidatus Helarchaeota archaeon]
MEEPSYYRMESQAVIKSLESSEKGIPEEEANTRRAKYGLNDLPRGKRTSLIKLFFEQFKDILILILLVAIIVEFIVILMGAGGDLIDVIAIAGFIIMNSVIGLVSEYRSEKEMLALKKITEGLNVRVQRPDGLHMIDCRFLVPGEVILIEMGDKVPADARVIESINLETDEAPLTGESKPVKKNPKIIEKEAALGDRKNMIFSGTVVTYGRGIAIVTNTGLKTQIGRIATLLLEIEEAETPLQRKMTKVGFQLGILIIAICILVFIVGTIKAFVTGIPIDATLIIGLILAAVALAVAAMPSGLPVVITTCLALGMREMAQERALIKKLKAVETLGSVNVICSDKTGTLTKNEMTIRMLYANDDIVNVTGVGYGPIGEFLREKNKKVQPLEDIHTELLLRIGALCGTSIIQEKNGQWAIYGDPTEGCLLTVAMKAGINIDELKSKYAQIGEIPFSSDLKRMTTIHRTPENEIHAYIKGALDIILNRCNSIYKDGKNQPITENDRLQLL